MFGTVTGSCIDAADTPTVVRFRKRRFSAGRTVDARVKHAHDLCILIQQLAVVPGLDPGTHELRAPTGEALLSATVSLQRNAMKFAAIKLFRKT